MTITRKLYINQDMAYTNNFPDFIINTPKVLHFAHDFPSHPPPPLHALHTHTHTHTNIHSTCMTMAYQPFIHYSTQEHKILATPLKNAHNYKLVWYLNGMAFVVSNQRVNGHSVCSPGLSSTTDFFVDMSGQISSQQRQLSTKQWSGNKCSGVPTKFQILNYIVCGGSPGLAG